MIPFNDFHIETISRNSFWAESLGRHRATADLIGHHSLFLVAYKKVSEIIENVQLETIRFEKSSFNPLVPYNFSKKPFFSISSR